MRPFLEALRRLLPERKRLVMPDGPARRTPAVSPHVRASLQDGALVLLDVSQGLLFKSNGIGARIWRGLSEGLSAREIAGQLSAEFSVTAERVEQDVLQFLTDLQIHGLATTGGGC